jgi:hypothetical protein
MRADKEPIDANPLTDKWSGTFIGKYNLQDIQLSSMKDFEDAEHGRMARDLFKQFKDH